MVTINKIMTRFLTRFVFILSCKFNSYGITANGNVPSFRCKPLAPRTEPLIVSATIANPNPLPNAKIRPKNTMAGRLGLMGFSGKVAGSN